MDDNRKKALSAALGQIEKQFGTGSIMRMGDGGPTAADLVNTGEPADLARIFWLYGEERQSRRIASAIARRRETNPFTRTTDLAEVIERALGGRRGARVHPATRAFQALPADVQFGNCPGERVFE